MAGAALSLRRALTVATVGVVLTLLAFTFDASPLFVCGIGFALLGAVAPLLVWLGSRGAEIERRLPVERVVEGEPFEATLMVRGGHLALLLSVVREPLADRAVALRGAGRDVALRVITRFEHRGRQILPPPALLIRDPLALAWRERRGAPGNQEVLVLPRTFPVSWRREDGGVRASVAAARAARIEVLAAVDVDGLRPYRVGTPASRIHWPALARGAGLLERRLQPDGDQRPLVVLDARGRVPAEQLDAAVRAAASLCLALALRGGCGLLLPGDRRPAVVEPDLIGWPAAHARLALEEGGPHARAPRLPAGWAAVGAVFYVAVQPLERPPAALGRAAGAAVLVLPRALCASALGRPCLEVAGCIGFLARQPREPRAAETAAKMGGRG